MTDEMEHGWELYWQSTATERYDGSANERVERALLDNNIDVTGRWGGTELATQESDNAILIHGTRTEARLAMRLTQGIVKHPVTLTAVVDDD